ncbi:MAG: hypothetical protein ABSD71_06195 [Bacteroidales bacterium]|jgi:hypothetical protein
MKTKYLFIMIIIFCPLYFYAQTESFNVFYVKGPVMLIEKNKKTELQKGMKINSDSKLMTTKNSVVVLFNKKGSPALIDTQGTYTYPQLCVIFEKKAGNSLIYDYFNYLANNLLESKIENSQAATVFRGDTIPMIFPSDSAWVYENKIEFIWKGNPSGQYFIIRNDNNEILKLFTRSGNLVLFPYSSGLKKGSWYSWFVSDNVNSGRNNTVNYFYIPYESEIKDLKNKELQVLAYLPEQKNEEYYTFMIGLFLRYHDYRNAYEQVKEAKEHKINSPSMQKLYLAVDKLYGMK